MKQVFLGQYKTNQPSTSAVRFNFPFGGVDNATWIASGSETSRTLIVGTAGTFRNLKVTLSGTPGSGKSYAFKLYVNGSGTTLLATVSDLNTSALDSTHNISVSAGDTIYLECTPSGTPTARSVSVALEFEGTTANYNMLCYRDASMQSGGARNHGITNGDSDNSIVEVDVAFPVPHACTIRSFNVKLNQAPGVGKSWLYSIFKNGVEDASTQGTIADNATTLSVTGLAVSLVAGDLISMKYVPSGTPAASTSGAVSVVFESTTNGNSIVLSKQTNTNQSATTYSGLVGGGNFRSTTEADSSVASGPTGYDLKNMYLLATTAPGASKSWAIQFRKNGSNVNNLITFTGTGTTANDTAHTDSIVENDVLSFSYIPTNTPAFYGNIRIGMTQYIAPTATAVFTKNVFINQAVNRASTY